jgi:dynein heavy chain
MVYLTVEDLGWRPYVKTWMELTYPKEDFPLDQELKDHLWELFELNIDMALDKIRENGVEPIKTDNLQLTRSVCNFLTVLIDPLKGFKGTNKQK